MTKIISPKQIKDRKTEAHLLRLTTDFLNQHGYKHNIVLTDVMLSSGGHDAKILILFDPFPDKAEEKIKQLNTTLVFKLRSAIAKNWTAKIVPKLKFVIDKGALNAKVVQKIFEKLEKPQE